MNKSDEQLVDNKISSHAPVPILVFCFAGTFISLFWLIALTAIIVDDGSQSYEPAFNDRVEVIDGFYRGQTGNVVNNDNTHPSCVSYGVKLDRDGTQQICKKDMIKAWE